MSYQIYFRLLGYVLSIAMHISNLLYIQYAILSANVSEGSMENFGTGTFKNMEYRYFTTWTAVVFTVFWTLLHYDRSLIFPAYLDKIITRLSNHVIHTMIVPVVVWEVMFWPRKPKSHYRNIAQLAIHMLAYIFVLHFTYHEHGVWLYPIFKAVQGTIHFYLLHFYVAAMCLMFYRLQWWLNSVIHGVEDVEKIRFIDSAVGRFSYRKWFTWAMLHERSQSRI
uniref:Uncharacterized protein n=1 Tax=Bombyx mori TaxID=7091 RepID=A0A8R2R4X1_BOMMO|nr:androgen-dependent TFPI-regulating protein isoform X2 [Bombyx mori]